MKDKGEMEEGMKQCTKEKRVEGGKKDYVREVEERNEKRRK